MTEPPGLPMRRAFEEFRQVHSLTPWSAEILARIETDARMPAVWETMARHGFTAERIPRFLLAILQAETRAKDGDVADKKVRTRMNRLPGAIRELEDFFSAQHDSSPEATTLRAALHWASEEIERRKVAYATAAAVLSPNSQKPTVASRFAHILSQAFQLGFNRPLDELVGVVVAVVLQTDETISADTIKKMRGRAKQRRRSR